MILDNERLRSLARYAYEASMDAHGYPVPSTEAWDFMVTQVLPEDEGLTDHDLQVLEACAVPDEFHNAYEERIAEASKEFVS
jgi:hypothetical protein